MKNIIFLVMVCLFISACNTIQGVGKDIEKGGTAIQKSTQ